MSRLGFPKEVRSADASSMAGRGGRLGSTWYSSTPSSSCSFSSESTPLRSSSSSRVAGPATSVSALSSRIMRSNPRTSLAHCSSEEHCRSYVRSSVTSEKHSGAQISADVARNVSVSAPRTTRVRSVKSNHLSEKAEAEARRGENDLPTCTRLKSGLRWIIRHPGFLPLRGNLRRLTPVVDSQCLNAPSSSWTRCFSFSCSLISNFCRVARLLRRSDLAFESLFWSLFIMSWALQICCSRSCSSVSRSLAYCCTSSWRSSFSLTS
mmetsp:Transcript_24210/g.68548  ORF Transcript_24210/g.68548 Transcript_24210/m.68548 type:complete len:265 (+) Transcript_24210:437-1231(+)